MANTNDFVGWALANGANILSVTNYKAAAIRQQGSQNGIADALTFNNSIRQATSVAAMVAQFTADWNTLTGGAGNVQDNADLVTLEAQFVNALTALITTLITPISGSYYHFGGTETGTSGAFVLAAPSPTIASLVPGTTIIFKPSRASIGSDTLTVSGLATKALVREDGSAIQANDITTAGFPLVAYDGTRWVLVAVLQTVAGVPVATTTSNGIARQATTAEMTAGATSGSTPAFVTPEGLAIYSEPKWTHVSRSASGTETKYNEFISLTGSSNFTTTLATAVGVALGYIISNDSTASQNIGAVAGTFYGGSDVIGGSTFLVIPAGAIAFLRADGTNWEVQNVYAPATTTNRGDVRLATDAEGTNGVTTGSSPAVMTAERVALFFAAHVANITTRGISRQATTAEATAGVTSGSSPAFVTPEGLGLFGKTDTQTFTAQGTGTWTRPAGYPDTARIAIEIWGAGGGSCNTNGGSGGDYARFETFLGFFPSSCSVYVGVGGIASHNTGGENALNSGGYTFFAKGLFNDYFCAKGGDSTGGGAFSPPGPTPAGQNLAAFETGSHFSGTPGNVIWAGGGGANNPGSGAGGGASIYGGKGGDHSQDGAQPGGGGGGGTSTGTPSPTVGGKGGDGKVVVKVMR